MTNKTIDINESTIKTYVESLRPEKIEIREQIDIGYSYDGKLVILFEIRPDWNDKKRNNDLNLLKFDVTNQEKS